MKTLNLSPSLNASNISDDIGTILERYDRYIFRLAQTTLPRYLMKSQDEVDLEIDEIAQRSRIKLWHALQRQSISSLKSYIKRIVLSESIDMMRRQKSHAPLTTDEDGEVIQGTILIRVSEETKNPEIIVWQREGLHESFNKIICAISELSEKQRLATLYRLKDAVDHSDKLGDILLEHDIHIEYIEWPERKKDLETLKASFSVAKRKIAQSMSVDLSLYKRT